MPLLFRKSKSSAFQRARDWATSLGVIGRALDKSGLDLRDLALSLVGEEVWVCGAVWWSERVQSGWTTVTLRLDGDCLSPVGSSAMPKRSPSGHTGRAGWEAKPPHPRPRLAENGPGPRTPPGPSFQPLILLAIVPDAVAALDDRTG